MTNVKRYFAAHVRANLKSFIYILVVVLALTLMIGIEAQPGDRYDYVAQQWYEDYKSTLSLPVTFMCILTYVIPVMEFSFFKRRISLDCAYSLPISRRAMGAVHYLVGLIMLLTTFSASYLVNFILLLTRGPGWFDFVPMIGHYFLCLLLGFAMYSVIVFVFNEANTARDGIWFIVLYSFVFPIIASALDGVLELKELVFDVYGGVLWGTIDLMTTSYQYLVEINAAGLASFFELSYNIFWLVFWIALGIASAVGFFLTFGRRRMEKTEEISDSFFGFRTLIPIYAVCGMILFEVSYSVIFWLIIEVLTILGYTIYRRGFHYRKSDIAVMLLLLIFLFV